MQSPNFILQTIARLCSFCFLICMVITVIKFTHFPDLDAPEISCDRPCHELEWPRICRLKFILESHSIPYRNCSSLAGQCSFEELQYKAGNKLLTVNRQIPGPKIHVCVHDILLVDVVNRLPDTSVSIHWRGQVHRNEPMMDGVPMISQCPIPTYTTFQYRFRASDPGTHFWHLHNKDTGSAALNNIYGLMVVREAKKVEPHSAVVDYDQSDHTIIVRSVENHSQSSILINGRYAKAKVDSPVSFQVLQNKRYRFRLAYGGGDIKCPISCTIEDHKLLIIALDGNAIQPVSTSKITLVPGERTDFVLRANQAIKTYSIQFNFIDGCHMNSSSYALLNYTNNKAEKTQKIENDNKFPYKPVFSTIFNDQCDKNSFCLENIKAHDKVSNDVSRIDTAFYLFYNYRNFQIDGVQGSFKVANVNNITFTYPPSPLISQIADVPKEILCNGEKLPSDCDKENGNTCQCTHVIDINVGSVVELILVHQEKNAKHGHIFHLHGHKFYILGRRKLDSSITVDEIKDLDAAGKLIDRNVENPPKKDTLIIPPAGMAVIRFVADNPGYWLLEEESGSHGMEVVFNVIGSQHNVPESFPRCGNWIGPKYFFA
ncbi:uncharacterized protein LOC135832526 isoform X2 [Planococcus citri]|uniref:uncharacterized protein LOC135832526 isoform X2 n=1 Tax=Planococcus citri TaxID=170843 RepID=UPI0031F74448